MYPPSYAIFKRGRDIEQRIPTPSAELVFTVLVLTLSLRGLGLRMDYPIYTFRSALVEPPFLP